MRSHKYNIIIIHHYYVREMHISAILGMLLYIPSCDVLCIRDKYSEYCIFSMCIALFSGKVIYFGRQKLTALAWDTCVSHTESHARIYVRCMNS